MQRMAWIQRGHNRHVVRVARGIGLALAAVGGAAQPVTAPERWEVYRSERAWVWVAERPPAQAKAGALPVQVGMEAQGAPLILHADVQAASALAALQVRCRSGVWAVEQVTAYDGPEGSGTAVMRGQAPAGQLHWQRIHAQQPSPSGLLPVWLAMAAARMCEAAGHDAAAADLLPK